MVNLGIIEQNTCENWTFLSFCHAGGRANQVRQNKLPTVKRRFRNNALNRNHALIREEFQSNRKNSTLKLVLLKTMP